MKLLPTSFGFVVVVVLRHGLPDSPAWPGIFGSPSSSSPESGVAGVRCHSWLAITFWESSLSFSYRLIERISAWPLLPTVELPVSPSKF